MRNPSSHNRQLSYLQSLAVCFKIKLRAAFVKRNNCKSGFAYELTMCVSNPEYVVLL